jgi:hypothetical protein
VKSHTGVKYNEEADKSAALGVTNPLAEMFPFAAFGLRHPAADGDASAAPAVPAVVPLGCIPALPTAGAPRARRHGRRGGASGSSSVSSLSHRSSDSTVSRTPSDLWRADEEPTPTSIAAAAAAAEAARTRPVVPSPAAVVDSGAFESDVRASVLKWLSSHPPSAPRTRVAE